MTIEQRYEEAVKEIRSFRVNRNGLKVIYAPTYEILEAINFRAYLRLEEAALTCVNTQPMTVVQMRELLQEALTELALAELDGGK